MKTIESIQIWDNGEIKTVSVLDAYATNVYLNKDATFKFQLFSLYENGRLHEVVASGDLFMDSEVYATWDQDDVAWDFVAKSLNLIITGDYVIPQLVEEIQPISEENA